MSMAFFVAALVLAYLWFGWKLTLIVWFVSMSAAEASAE
jgi:hypothetical protein